MDVPNISVPSGAGIMVMLSYPKGRRIWPQEPETQPPDSYLKHSPHSTQNFFGSIESCVRGEPSLYLLSDYGPESKLGMNG